MERNILKFKTTARGGGAYDYKEHVWDISQQLDIETFLQENPEFAFEQVGQISPSQSKCGFKIDVVPEWQKTERLLYLLVVNNKILKGGKCKNALPSRSYSAGTEESWTMRGTPSPTNYIWSQIFRKCLKNNVPIQFYCFRAPDHHYQYNVFGENIVIKTSPYEEYEKVLNDKLKKSLGRNPIGEGSLEQQLKH